MIYEISKICKQKLMMILLVLMFFVMLIQSITFHPIHRFTQSNSQEIYEEQLAVYRGKLTEDKKNQFHQEYMKIIDLKTKRDDLYDTIHQKSYELSDASVKEMKQNLEQVNSGLLKMEAYQTLKDEIDYVKENPKEREVIDPIGWKSVIQDDGLSYPLIICLLLINITLFTMEYENEMHSLTISTKKGKKYTFRSKCYAGLLCSFLCILIALFLHDIPYFLHYDFSDIFAPIHSVPAFAHMSLNISCIQILLIIQLMKVIGYLSFSVLIWIISICLKKFISVFSILLSTILLMNFCISLPYIYYVPFSLSFMKATGFFRGNEQIVLNKGSDGEFIVQTYVGGNKLLEIIMAIIWIFVIVYALYKVYQSFCNIHKKIKFKKKVIALFIICLLSGCSNKVSIKDTTRMNINDTFLPYRDGVLFIDQNKIKYINLKNQEIEDFIKDISPQVFEGQKEKMIVQENVVCYMNQQNSSIRQGYDVDCYDIDKHKVKTIYTSRKDYQSEMLFGLIKQYHVGLEDAPRLTGMRGIFIYHNQLYYFDEENHLMNVDINDTKNINVVLSDYSGNGILDGDNFYYISTTLDLKKYDLSERKSTIISKDFVSQVSSYNNTLYFTTLNKKGVFTYHDGKIEHIIKENVRLIAVNDFYIYTQDINGVCVIYDKTTHQQVKTVSISFDVIQGINDIVLTSETVEGVQTIFQYDGLLSHKIKLMSN